MRSQTPEWTPRLFAALWSSRDLTKVAPVLTEDVVGHWVGPDDPADGREPYGRYLALFWTAAQ